MRKSERLRLAEMQIVRLEMQIDILSGAINSLMDSINTPAPVVASPNLEAQKWYTRETE
jgi:hypothetical protein